MLPSSFSSFGPVVSEEKIFKNGPIRNKNCLVSEEKIFLNRPIRYKNCLFGFVGEDFFKSTNHKQELPVAAMSDNRSGQNEQSLERTFHRCFLPSVSSFGRLFQRRRLKCEKLTDDRQQISEEKIKM